MKATTLFLKMVDGTSKVIGAETSAPMIELGKQIRSAGAYEGLRVLWGLVQNSERPFPVLRFRIRSDAVVIDDKPKKVKASRKSTQ